MEVLLLDAGRYISAIVRGYVRNGHLILSQRGRRSVISRHEKENNETIKIFKIYLLNSIDEIIKSFENIIV